MNTWAISPENDIDEVEPDIQRTGFKYKTNWRLIGFIKN